MARKDQLIYLKRLNLLVNWLGRKFQLYTGFSATGLWFLTGPLAVTKT